MGKTRRKEKTRGKDNMHLCVKDFTIPYQKKCKKTKAQQEHILMNNSHVMNSIVVEKSGIKITDVVLEINPGIGKLTKRLLDVGKSVVAFESDPNLAKDLEAQFKNVANLKVIQGDILNCELPHFDVCVANLPLNSSYPITFKLLSHRPLFRSAVIIVQREFAMKLTAQPNDSFYCRLSANIQLLASVTHLTKVPKNNFSPPYKSNLSVVLLKPKDPSPSVNFKDWLGLVGFCFLKRSKTLGSVFRLKKILSELEKNSNKSLEDVSRDNDLDISAYISALGNAFGDLTVEGDDEDDMEMEVEMEGGDTKGDEFKDRVMGVLKEARFEHKRCYQLTQPDILSLLGLFNKAGIYFS